MKKKSHSFLDIYDFLYYHFYKGALWSNGESDYPHQTAVFVLSGLLFQNLFTITIVIVSFIGNKAIKWSMNVDPIYILPFCFLILYLHKYLFLRNKRYLHVIKKYENETPKQNMIGRFLMWFYFLGSIVLFILVLIIFC